MLTVVPLSLFNITADAATSGYYTYSVSDGEATITDVGTFNSGSVTIPSTLGGYTVTTIGDWAFFNCQSLTSVTIPNSVTSIGDNAFYYCKRLTSVTIGSGVTSIGDIAFSDCTRLTSITVNSSNSYYSSQDGVLFNKNKTTLIQYPIGKTITSYTIPSTVTSIGMDAFKSCSSLTNVTIPNSVTSIGASAFNSCDSLTSVTIPNSVTTICGSAFEYCDSLTSVTIPNSVTTIYYYAFYSCDSLTSITVNSGNSYYSSQDGVLFNKNKTTLIQYPIGKTSTSYTIPNSVTTIDSYAFADCNSLTSVTIPNSVTSIGSEAFLGCGSLTSVTIGSGVTIIDYGAFSDCDSLTSVTIPSSVTSIGKNAFYGCDSLTSVTIPSSVTSIGKNAFYGCNKLADVYYSGTESQKAQITIGVNNTPLTNATWHYNYCRFENYVSNEMLLVRRTAPKPHLANMVAAKPIHVISPIAQLIVSLETT